MSGDGSYEVPDFSPNAIVQNFHASPRLVGTNEFTSLDTDDNDEYLIGLATAGAALFIGAVLMLVFVPLWYCCSRCLCRCLPCKLPCSKITVNNMWRVVFGVGLMFMITGIVLMFGGIDNTKHVVGDVGDSMIDAAELFEDGEGFIQDIIDEIRDINRPNGPVELMLTDGCAAIDDLRGPLQELLQAIADSGEEFLDITDGMGGVIRGAVKDMQEGQSLMYSGSLIVGVVALAFCCWLIFTWVMTLYCKRPKVAAVSSWVTQPILWLVTVLCWILAGLFLIIGSAIADYCMDPNANILALNDSNLISYYVTCTGVSPMQGTLDSMLDNLQEAIDLVQQVVDEGGNLAVPCAESTLGHAQTIADSMSDMKGSLANAGNLVNCESLSPTYVTFVHDGMCTSLMNSLGPIFAGLTMFAIAGSLVVLLFRTVTAIEVDDEADEDLLDDDEMDRPEEGDVQMDALPAGMENPPPGYDATDGPVKTDAVNIEVEEDNMQF
jgi:hypothetical protein